MLLISVQRRLLLFLLVRLTVASSFTVSAEHNLKTIFICAGVFQQMALNMK